MSGLIESTTEALSAVTARHLDYGNYNGATNLNTGMVKADANGELANATLGTDFTKGTGTTNRIPKFTATGTIGDSSVSDDGTTVSTAEKLSVTNTTAATSPAAAAIVSAGGVGAQSLAVNSLASASLVKGTVTTGVLQPATLGTDYANGTGTTNRLSKFTGTGTIGDSAVSDVAGAVTVGVTGGAVTHRILGNGSVPQLKIGVDGTYQYLFITSIDSGTTIESQLGPLVIKNAGINNDVYIKVDDGGVEKTAIQIDASENAAISLINLASGGIVRAAPTTGLLSIATPGEYYLSYYGTCAAAIAAIGATVCDLVIDISESLAADTTFPATTNIKWQNAAVLTIASGKTLTINRMDPSAPLRQLFAGAGSVVFGDYVADFRAEWFGLVADGTTEDTSAVQAAITALPVNGLLDFKNKTIYCGRVDLKSNITIVNGNFVQKYSGTSPFGAYGAGSTDASPVFRGKKGISDVVIRNCTFVDDPTSYPSIGAGWLSYLAPITLHQCHRVTIDGCKFTHSLSSRGVFCMGGTQNNFINCVYTNCGIINHIAYKSNPLMGDATLDATAFYSPEEFEVSHNYIAQDKDAYDCIFSSGGNHFHISDNILRYTNRCRGIAVYVNDGGVFDQNSVNVLDVHGTVSNNEITGYTDDNAPDMALYCFGQAAAPVIGASEFYNMRVVFSDNVVHTTGNGIKFYHSPMSIASNNHITADGYGLNVSDDCDGLNVSDNWIECAGTGTSGNANVFAGDLNYKKYLFSNNTWILPAGTQYGLRMSADHVGDVSFVGDRFVQRSTEAGHVAIYSTTLESLSLDGVIFDYETATALRTVIVATATGNVILRGVVVNEIGSASSGIAIVAANITVCGCTCPILDLTATGSVEVTESKISQTSTSSTEPLWILNAAHAVVSNNTISNSKTNAYAVKFSAVAIAKLYANKISGNVTSYGPITCVTSGTLYHHNNLVTNAGAGGIQPRMQDACVNGSFLITDTTDATAADTGSVQTKGGLYVAKRYYGAGRITTDDATDAASTTDGSIQTDGGLSVVKRIVAGDDIAILADSKNLELGAGSDMFIYYDGTNGNIDTDPVAPSDLTIDCGTDKTVVLEVPVWDDMRITPGSFDRPGISDPSIVAYDVNGGGVSTYLWEFAKNNVASFTVQLPHSYKAGTDIRVHIHWTPGSRGAAESGATVGWKVQYSWANIDGAFGTMATADLSDACDGTDHKHQMTPAIAITGSTKAISSMLLCNVTRTDTGADDTWAGTVSGQRPMLLEIDFHYEIDTMGSRTVSAK